MKLKFRCAYCGNLEELDGFETGQAFVICFECDALLRVGVPQQATKDVVNSTLLQIPLRARI